MEETTTAPRKSEETPLRRARECDVVAPRTARKPGESCPAGTNRNRVTCRYTPVIALSDQLKARTPTRLVLRSTPCITYGEPYLQCRPASRSHLGAGIRTGAHSPVPSGRIPQPHPESGQGRRPTMDRRGPVCRAIFCRSSVGCAVTEEQA